MVTSSRKITNRLSTVSFYCSPSPCLHGSCTVVYTKERYNCSCDEGYTGRNCTEEIDECASDPCINNGTCYNGLGFYECNCPDAWNGTNCELDFNECDEAHEKEYCMHGICTNFHGGYKCSCSEGYYGDKCQHKINENQALIISFVVCLVFFIMAITGLVILTYKQRGHIQFLERQQEELSSKVYYNVATTYGKSTPERAYTCESASVVIRSDHGNTENQDQQILDYEKLQKDASDNIPNMYDAIAKN